jgi:hypothetical protein
MPVESCPPGERTTTLSGRIPLGKPPADARRDRGVCHGACVTGRGERQVNGRSKFRRDPGQKDHAAQNGR